MTLGTIHGTFCPPYGVRPVRIPVPQLDLHTAEKEETVHGFPDGTEDCQHRMEICGRRPVPEREDHPL